MKALVIAVSRSGSMTVRHNSSRVCRALRVAAHDGIEAGCLARCIRAGGHSVAAVIRAFVAKAHADSVDLRALVLADECIDDAVGAVVVHRINAGHLAHWSRDGRDPEYARPEHLCTLIVAGAVNVDEWRKTLIARGLDQHRHLVYSRVPRCVDEWSARAWDRSGCGGASSASSAQSTNKN
jgi:hypothetical protein